MPLLNKLSLNDKRTEFVLILIDDFVVLMMMLCFIILISYHDVVLITMIMLSCWARNKMMLMVQWVVRSILHGGPIELFIVPASVPRLV